MYLCKHVFSEMDVIYNPYNDALIENKNKKISINMLDNVKPI